MFFSNLSTRCLGGGQPQRKPPAPSLWPAGARKGRFGKPLISQPASGSFCLHPSIAWKPSRGLEPSEPDENLPGDFLFYFFAEYVLISFSHTIPSMNGHPLTNTYGRPLKTSLEKQRVPVKTVASFDTSAKLKVPPPSMSA